MKYLNLILILSVLICFQQTSFAAQTSNLGSKIKLKDPNDVSQNANQENAYGSEFSNPFMDATMSGFGNMMQGMTGNYQNIQSVRDQQRMQADYVKQATPNSDDE